MKYSLMRKFDVTNGPGIRSTIFVSGCTHSCKGCFNEELQSFDYGTEWDLKAEKEFISFVENPVVVGVNILGGEPLQQTMDDSLVNLLEKLKTKFPDKSIWLWTGDTFEDAILNEKKFEIIKYCDVIVDGKFELENRDIKLKYRGSNNQRVIDVLKSLETGTTITFDIN